MYLLLSQSFFLAPQTVLHAPQNTAVQIPIVIVVCTSQLSKNLPVFKRVLNLKSNTLNIIIDFFFFAADFFYQNNSLDGIITPIIVSFVAPKKTAHLSGCRLNFNRRLTRHSHLKCSIVYAISEGFKKKNSQSRCFANEQKRTIDLGEKRPVGTTCQCQKISTSSHFVDESRDLELPKVSRPEQPLSTNFALRPF